MANKLKPITPGQFLKNQFLDPLNISQNKLARDLDVPPPRINAIIHGKTRITPDMALRLAKYFKTSAEYWLNLQQHFDLNLAKQKFNKAIEKRVSPFEMPSHL